MPKPLRSQEFDFSRGYVPELVRYRPEKMPRGSVYAASNCIIRDGALIKRHGSSRFNIHPVGFTQIATFEVAEGWSNSADDGTKFKQGANSKKYTVSSSPHTTALSFAAKNLDGTSTDNTFEFWAYFEAVLDPLRPKFFPHITQIRVRLYSTDPTAYFEQTVFIGSAPDIVLTSIGWHHFSLRKGDFTAVGGPTWLSIIKAEFRFSKSPGAEAIINLDDFILNIQESGGNNKILNIIDYIRKDGTQKVIARWGTVLSESVSAHTGWTDIVTGLTLGKRQSWSIFNDHLITGNGTDNNFKYKTAKTNLGIVAPPAAPTFNANINGTMVAGNYFYRFVYYNSSTAHKSNPSPASASLTAAADPNDGIRLNIPSNGGVDTQVDKVLVYRTLIGATVNSEYFRVPGDVAYTGSATTFDDTTPDSALLSEILEYDHDVPPKFTMCDHDDSFMYYVDAANPSKVWRSKLSDPESVPVTSYVDIAPDDGDQIRALKVTNEGVVVVFKQYSKHRIIDIDGITMGHKKINDRGTFNNESVTKLPSGLMYSNEDGVWLFNGSIDISVGDALRSDLSDTLSAANTDNCLMGYDRVDKLIRYAVTKAAQNQNTLEYVYDTREQTWMPHAKMYSAVGTIVQARIPVDVYGTYDGLIMKNEDAIVDSDDEADIAGFGESPWIDFGAPHRMKKFRALILWVKAAGSYQLSVKFVKAYSTSEGDEVLVSVVSGSLWGTFVWGVDKWGAESVLRVEIPIPIGSRIGSAIKVRFGTNLRNQPFEIKKFILNGQIMRARVQ